MNHKFLQVLTILLISLSLISCGGFKKVDQRQQPDGSKAKMRKNVEEGRGVTIGGALKRGSTTYEFSTSNPMWRASLETLDFLPLTTVDYSGGMIITDWYTDNDTSQKESIKISLRFLANEVRSENLKVVVHKKMCSADLNCKVTLLSNSRIKQELHSAIMRKAALLEKESKKKKK